jgi:Uma2 family endonuclease
MASVPRPKTKIEYPTSDGRPMAETDWHRNLMMALIQTLMAFFANEPMTYVSGNLLIFYVPGNKRRHVAPDVFVVKGVPKHERPYYLLWEEGKGPDAVIEVTSKTTRKEDLASKFQLYQNVLKVREYFLFDPFGEYLAPALQGHRLRRGRYVPIRLFDGRLPSEELGLHLVQHGKDLRLYDQAALDARQQSDEQLAQLRREMDELRRRLPPEV